MQSLDTFLRGTGIYQLFQQEDWCIVLSEFAISICLVVLCKMRDITKS